MNIKIKQKNLIKILDLLMLDNIFPHCPLIVEVDDKENVSLNSYQRLEGNHVLRFAHFKKDFFEYIEAKPETININAKKLHKVVSKLDPDTTINMFTEEKKLRIKTQMSDVKLHTVDTSDGALDKIPFGLDKDGTISFNDGACPNRIIMSKNSLKKIVEYGSVLDTQLYQFNLEENEKFTVRIGDLESNAERAVYTPTAKISKYGNPAKTVVSLAMSAMSKVFSGDIHVQLKTTYPTFFSETSHKHFFGVVVAPYIEGED